MKFSFSPVKHLLFAVAVTCVAFFTSGCFGIGGIATGRLPSFTDNALRVEFQRPPQEAINDFQDFLQRNGMEVASTTAAQIQSAPGSFVPDVSGSNMPGAEQNRSIAGEQEVRIVAAAEPGGRGSELTIVTQYLNRTTGNWERAEFDRNLFSFGSGMGNANSQALYQIYSALTRRYGADNVEHVNSDLDYTLQSRAAEAETPPNDSPAPPQQAEREAPSDEERTSAPSEAPASETAQERPGDGGKDTAWVQRTLNGLGMDCGTADGVMGPSTRSCIRSFQKANGLNVTGEVNEATYETMLERL